MAAVYLMLMLFLLCNELSYGKIVTDEDENIVYNYVMKLVKPDDSDIKTIDIVDNNIDAETIPEAKCAEIGEFCMNNSDCCSNLCLGYMKRCVSSHRFLIIVMTPK